MKDKFRKCSSCAFFECVDIDGEFVDKGWCSLLPFYTFVEDDDICEDYILDKEVEKDIECGMWR